MKRPILIITIGYIIGIIWGLYFKISIVLLYAILIVLYIIINWHYKKRKFKILSIKRYFRYIKKILTINIILIIIITSFISNTIVKYQNNKYETIYKDNTKIEITGVIVSNKKDGKYKLKVNENNTNLYLRTTENLEYGDLVTVKGEYQEPQSQRNYKGFDYKEYLKTLKIYGTIKAEKIKLKNKNCGNTLLRISNKVFNKIKNNIETTYSKKTSDIILGIMLGYTEQIDESTREDFSQSGISHVLAVSGLHVSYIIYLVINGTQKVVGKRKSKIITSIVLLIYMFITDFSVSIVRAGIMGIIDCMAFIFYRKSDTINNIAISMLTILLYNPFSLTSTSFLLTYFGTIGIILFQKQVKTIIKNIKIKNRKWKYVFLRIQRKCEGIIDVISVSISVQIAIIPIIMLKFNTFNLSFIITNVLLSMVIGVIVILGFTQTLISFISIQAGMALAQIISIPIYGLILISKINIGNFKVVTPDIWQIIVYYIIVLSISYLYRLFNSKKLTVTQVRVKNIIHLIKYKLKPYISKFKIGLVILIILFVSIKFLPSNLKIFFIDVSQGDATLILTPNKQTILIDGGGSSTYDVGKNTLLPYLLDRKIKQIDYVIISHFDLDHVGGILYLLKEIKVDNVIISKQFEESENYNSFLEIVKEKNLKVHIVEAGNKINIEKNLYFDVLSPINNQVISKNSINNNALVCKLNYKKFSMLFTGDIEEETEKVLVSKYGDILRSTILKVAHHGSKSSSTQEFINLVKPKIALIGVGENNTFGHPNDEVLERLKNIRC